MNTRRILFSSAITGLICVGLGLVTLSLAPSPYSGQPYRNLQRTYTVIGGIAGLLIGASQETIRQLKQKQDEEEALDEQFRQVKAAYQRLPNDQR